MPQHLNAMRICWFTMAATSTSSQNLQTVALLWIPRKHWKLPVTRRRQSSFITAVLIFTRKLASLCWSIALEALAVCPSLSSEDIIVVLVWPKYCMNIIGSAQGKIVPAKMGPTFYHQVCLLSTLLLYMVGSLQGLSCYSTPKTLKPRFPVMDDRVGARA